MPKSNSSNLHHTSKQCKVCHLEVFKSNKPNDGYYKVKVGNEVKETQIDLNGIQFHKLCAKCSICGTFINSSNLGHLDLESDSPSMLCKDHSNQHSNNKIENGDKGALYGSVDPSSNSNPRQIECKNLYLQWTLDFEDKKVFGTATHVVSVKENGTESVIFDQSGLIFSSVYINNDVADFSVTDDGGNSVIIVKIPADLRMVGSELTISFVYRTGVEASAVQWLEKEATQGGEYPYVFTQSQAIHARSMFPCFDAPGVKVPYSAAVTAPMWCTVLMSAVSCATNSIPESIIDKYPTEFFSTETELTTFYWDQPVPVSSYLVAFAAGQLSSFDISPRVRVWSEPEVIEKAAWEFAQTEEFLCAAEKITDCSYQWGRYDVLCLPPSFPYGGMENPCLTFATPTLLAGDRYVY